ncbi:MAG: hypothetical protein ACKOC9_17080, partial [Alphaproteobacteria bacterium]
MPDATAALALPFEADDILARLMRWAACESPTFDANAVNRMMDLASRDLALLGARIDRIPGRVEGLPISSSLVSRIVMGSGVAIFAAMI